MAKIVMVTGVQRSGTGALFYALAEDLGVRVFQESNASEFYLGWNLRSETELRPLLTASAQTVLTKPVNETSRRSVAELLREFTAHETWIVWIYRDPVNVFASTLEWYSVPRNANDRFYKFTLRIEGSPGCSRGLPCDVEQEKPVFPRALFRRKDKDRSRQIRRPSRRCECVS